MYNVSFSPRSFATFFSSIYINITNDNVVERDERFHVTIDPSSLPTGVILGRYSQATVEIDNTDCK